MAAISTPRTLPRALQRAAWHWHISRRTGSRRIVTAAAVESNDLHATHRIPPESAATTGTLNRKEAVRNAKPFSDFLTDTFDRQHDYLRISVTERCNLRCLYCMPEEGIELSPKKELLTSAEIYYLSALFVNQGVNKIRLTGGEPTVRKDILSLMQKIGSLRKNGLKELALTTNGISLHRKLDAMVEAGLTGVNISLDTLDPFEFQLLTRRQGFDAVMKSINRVQEMNKLGAGVKLKINAVIMRGLNDHQVMPFVEMTKYQDVEVRFIEYMPFGGNKWSQNKMLPYSEMLDMIRERYPDFSRLRDAKNDTSKTWQVPGFKGRVGFITSMTHNFCGTCNRLRITSDGNLKVCLHGNAEVSLRDILRTHQNGEPLDEEAFENLRKIEIDRRQGSNQQTGAEEGWVDKERQLLDVIGAAVKRKKAKHAGMGELQNMKNRPMILIGKEKASGSLRSCTRHPFTAPPSPFPWRALPPHLLRSSTTGIRDQRCYSSLSRTSEKATERSIATSEEKLHHKNDEKEAAENGNSEDHPPSIFQFQSLSGLFPKSTRDASNNSQHTEGKQDPSDINMPPLNSLFNDSQNKPVINETTGLSKVKYTHVRDKKIQIPDRMKLPLDQTSGSKEKLAQRSGFRRMQVAPAQTTSRKKIEIITQPSRTTVANPFAQKGTGNTSSKSSEREEKEKAWGIEQNKKGIVGPTGTAATLNLRPTVGAFKKPLGRYSSALAGHHSPKLTHLTSSGEAYMVDVGDKPSTKRVAIAVCTISFSNSESSRLITENNNKKGDVLGVARIAGIMAAKRTPDLIPLCHPLALSKVELDVKLEQHGEDRADNKMDPGSVHIMATVECVGSTGVEMEAMTAVTVAGLTVVDMCKAVDRKIHIRQCHVVYKAGGKSGLFIDDDIWSAHPTLKEGKSFFVQRGLELPG